MAGTSVSGRAATFYLQQIRSPLAMLDDVPTNAQAYPLWGCVMLFTGTQSSFATWSTVSNPPESDGQPIEFPIRANRGLQFRHVTMILPSINQ